LDKEPDMNEKENPDEVMEVTPKELEFAFAQCVRFGSWLHFLVSNREACGKVFEKHLGPGYADVETLLADENSGKTDKKKEALLELTKVFLGNNVLSKGTGKEIQRQISSMYADEAVWNNVELFIALCNELKKRQHKKAA